MSKVGEAVEAVAPNQETNMSSVSEVEEAVYDSQENESVANSESWRDTLGYVAPTVRMVISPWYLDELGNPTRTVRGT